MSRQLWMLFTWRQGEWQGCGLIRFHEMLFQAAGILWNMATVGCRVSSFFFSERNCCRSCRSLILIELVGVPEV